MYIRVPDDQGWEPPLLVHDLEEAFIRLKKRDPFSTPFIVYLGAGWRRFMRLRFYKGINRLKTTLGDRIEQMLDVDRLVLLPINMDREPFEVRIEEAHCAETTI